jgi:CheY-like chemotaxis protein
MKPEPEQPVVRAGKPLMPVSRHFRSAAARSVQNDPWWQPRKVDEGLSRLSGQVDIDRGVFSVRERRQFSPATVLIAEDDPDLRGLLDYFLRSRDFFTLAADNGRAALDIVAQADIDVLVTDIHMPLINGIDVITALRTRGFRGPILVLTSDSSPVTTSRAIAAGANGFLWKPVNFDLLGEWVAKTQTLEGA